MTIVFAACGTPVPPSDTSALPSESEAFFLISQAELRVPAPVWTAPGGREQERLSESVVFAIGGLRAGWNRIEYFDVASRDWRFGWLAPDRQLEALPPTRCPRADAAHVLSLFQPEAELCFRGQELTLAPVFLDRDPPRQPSHTGTPEWLASPTGVVAYAKREGDAGALMVHLDPATVDQDFVAGWYSIVGHFDDPRSVNCVRSATPPFVPESIAEQQLWCRQQLVLTSIEPVPAPGG